MDIVVTVAASLVNTLTPGEERGHPYPPVDDAQLPAAATAALRAGSPATRDVTLAEATELRRFAMAFRAVFRAVAAGDVDAAARQVNELIAVTGAHPGTDDSLAVGWAAGCATGLAVVLGSDLHDRIGVCTAARCDRVYVDTSRNGTRRFCSTTCQNRVKAAAFRARQAAVG